MKIKAEKNILVNALNIVSKAVPAKNNISILNCILINAEDKIELTANDTELGINTLLKGEILEKGMIAIDSKLLVDIIRKLPESDIIIHTDINYNVTISCGKSKFTIPGKSGEDYTYLPTVEMKNNITISQLSLKDIIRQTIFSIASNDNNPVMSGELFEIRDNDLRIIGIDGHRVAIRKIKIEGDNIDRAVIIPGKTLSEISKILTGGADDMVKIYFSDKNIMFNFEDTVVMSRLIDGKFFEIDKMLTSDYNTRITVNKREFLESIDRSTLLVKEGDKKPIVITITDDIVNIRIKSPLGSMDENIDIGKDGNDLVIGFNPRFMIDALRAIDDEIINIYMQNAKAPCYIKDENSNYIYMVLPVNVGNI